MTRSRLSPEQRESELLAAARVLLREVGYEQFLPAEVARRCGVSEGLVYRYFPAKRDLLARVATDWLAEILAAEPDFSGCADVAARLQRAIVYALGVVRAEPALTRYILLDLRAGPDYRGSALHQLNRRFTGVIMAVIHDGIAAGELRSDLDTTLIRDMIYGAVEHQTWAYLRGDGESPPEQVAASIVGILAGGILTGLVVRG
jgi:AcrR family transcriptional regulator